MEDTARPADIGGEILGAIADKTVTAAVIAGGDGIVSGPAAARALAEGLGLAVEMMLEEGGEVRKGEEIMRFSGSPPQVVRVGEDLVGLLAKPSGVATAARDFVKAAGKKPKIVCGAWRKMPPADREAICQAITSGGASCHISDDPYVLLDGNSIEMLGGIREAVKATAGQAADRTIAVQLEGRSSTIAREALEAAESGARILYVETGVSLDFMETAFELERAGLRKKVKIAFGGDLDLKDLREIKKNKFGIEIVAIAGRIADAPLLDMRLEIVAGP